MLRNLLESITWLSVAVAVGAVFWFLAIALAYLLGDVSW